VRIIEKIDEYKRTGKPFFSFEFFPPKTESGVHNLYARLDRMAAMEPAFIDITWGAAGSTHELTFDIAKNAQHYFNVEVMMHLTCTGLKETELSKILTDLKEAGISNVLALRGDPPLGQKKWQKCQDGFNYASELTSHIRKNFNDYFGIAVGGYPEGHLESTSLDACVTNLKLKVDAGADFIVTQLFYDLEHFFKFEKKCRAAGITCPIIPGILPIQTYSRFKKFTDFCKIAVPEEITERLLPIKDNDQLVHEYGVEVCTKMCQKLLEYGCPGLHFYTLNLESSVTAVLEKLDLIASSRNRRAFPWRPSSLPNRRKEDVRPIFWSNRPKSYLARTMDWDDFPNGRWGDSRSPSFGELDDYYLLRRGIGIDTRKEASLKAWGHPKTVADVGEVFSAFCEGKIDKLPWCEMPVQMETSWISKKLTAMNRKGMFTINSQPQVNGVSSNDPVVGWGGSDGYVYQKAYLEFFTSKENLDKLLTRINGSKTISFHAINVKGEYFNNVSDKNVNAVTWGVFPAKEITQPTIVDQKSFFIWKDEAFALWLSEWRSIYDEDSKSYQLIDEIYHNYFLVNIVENDYVNGDLFKIVGV